MKITNLLLLCFLLTTVCRAQGDWKIAKSELLFNNPPFKECHASTIIALPANQFLVAYFAGTREGRDDVGIWLSRQENGKWSAPSLVADGVVSDTLRYPTWNPVLFKNSGGKLFLFYKMGPSPQTWWGMLKTSADNGKTWSDSSRLPDGILGPIKNKPVQLADGSILSGSSTETKEYWRAHIERSTDQGTTWQVIPVDHAGKYNVIQPSILRYPGNRLQILCRSKENKVIQAFSEDNGKTWGALSETSLPNPNSGTDAVTLKDGQQLLVYNPTVRGKEWSNGRSKLNVAISKDGSNWKDIAVLENLQQGEFSYPAVIQAANGDVHITYTYDRKNVKHVVLKKK